MEKMFFKEVNKPAQKWTGPILSSPKAGGALQFWVHYRKLNAVTVQDVHSIRRMNEIID